MAMVMPRSFSSGALSISSNGVKSARPLSASTLVMAAVRVVLPWSMWPMVPMFTWGLLRSNFFLPMSSPPLLSGHPRHDLLGDLSRNLAVGVELHRAVRRAPLGSRPELGRVAEQLRQRHKDQDRLLRTPIVDPLYPPTARSHVTHHFAHELLRGGHLELHDRLQQDRVGSARGRLQRHGTGDLEGH